MCHVETSGAALYCHTPTHIQNDAYSEEGGGGSTNKTVCSLNRTLKHTGAEGQTDEQVFSASSSPIPLISLTLLGLTDNRPMKQDCRVWNRMIKGIDRFIFKGHTNLHL